MHGTLSHWGGSIAVGEKNKINVMETERQTEQKTDMLLTSH